MRSLGQLQSEAGSNVALNQSTLEFINQVSIDTDKKTHTVVVKFVRWEDVLAANSASNLIKG